MTLKQLDLFETVTNVYLDADVPVKNQELYARVAEKLRLDENVVNTQVRDNKNDVSHSHYWRTCRWVQQSLRQKRIIKRVSRGEWEMISSKKIELNAIKEGKRVLAMSTRLGICIWAKSDAVFRDLIDEPIHLILTSPPYPLKIARAYGNVRLSEYIDFVCRALEPIVDKMAIGASLALNVSNDIFEDGSPARSTYLERLIIAIEDRLLLKKMDVLQWCSNKPPGPIAWASKKRTQLNTGYEPVLWFCNDPLRCFSSNQRVLVEHTESHKRFMASGGLKTASVNGDGSYLKRQGSYGTVTEGRIPTNVLNISNYCHSGRAVTRYAKELSIAPHSAKMPLSLADFLIRFLTEPSQLVVDPFAGTLTTAQAAEQNNRRWVCTEMVWQYIRQSFVRFDDVWVNPGFANAFEIAA